MAIPLLTVLHHLDSVYHLSTSAQSILQARPWAEQTQASLPQAVSTEEEQQQQVQACHLSMQARHSGTS